MLLRLIDGTAENSGQRLDNVSLSHLELASDKLVQHKKLPSLSGAWWAPLGLAAAMKRIILKAFCLEALSFFKVLHCITSIRKG